MVQKSRTLSIYLPGNDYKEQAGVAFDSGDLWTVRLPEETEYTNGGNDPTPTAGPEYLDDPKGSYATSPWLGMRERRDEPTLTVLVMDRLGGMLTCDELNCNSC